MDGEERQGLDGETGQRIDNTGQDDSIRLERKFLICEKNGPEML